jgi:hypothetical protein
MQQPVVGNFGIPLPVLSLLGFMSNVLRVYVALEAVKCSFYTDMRYRRVRCAPMSQGFTHCAAASGAGVRAHCCSEDHFAYWNRKFHHVLAPPPLWRLPA